MGTTPFLDLVGAIVRGDVGATSKLLAAEPELARVAEPKGASRQNAGEYFFAEIRHYLYRGDTALHMAAAAFSREIAEMLVKNGADVRARNRRGAEPLHYCADADRSRPDAQSAVIEYLVTAGAGLNAVDNSGVSPLHRAVRTRSFAAVRTLLAAGADPRIANGSGSTPLHLAVQTTGASGSGTDDARRQQAQIIEVLLKYGARPTDKDANGKTVEQAATSKWVRELLA